MSANEGEDWDFVANREAQMAVDGGSGGASVDLRQEDKEILMAMARRTQSDPSAAPLTGAELGMAPQAPDAGSSVDGTRH